MKIEVLITDEKLRLEPLAMDECGAVARFDGLVRGSENGQSISGLEYDAYQPMAESVIRTLLESLHQEHPFTLARVHHRIGWVPVGEAAIIMEVHSRHRAEAFNVLQKFMDRLKQDVPIWKCSKQRSAERSADFQPASDKKRGQDAGAPVSDSNHRGQDARAPFFNSDLAIDKTQHWLPHWQQGEVWQFVTWRLEDALPASLLDQWKSERDAWLRHHPEPWDESTEDDYHRLFSVRMEEWLDAGHGSCLLRQPEVSAVVADSLEHFNGQRYTLACYVVMPNHVHVLFQPKPGYAMDAIVHSWKSFTANHINCITGRQGPLWQPEYFDRMMRSEAHLLRTYAYIMDNPTKAKLGRNHYRSATFQVASGNQRGQNARAPL